MIGALEAMTASAEKAAKALEIMSDVVQEQRVEIDRLRAALSGVVREWEEYRSDGWDGDVPFIVGVTMAGIARAALNNGEKQ